MDEPIESNDQDSQGKKGKIEQVIKLLLYIGTMSFVSLGYISREIFREDLTGLYKIIAFLFAISAIFSFISTLIIVANMNNKYTEIEKQWLKKGALVSILSFICGVIIVAVNAIFL